MDKVQLIFFFINGFLVSRLFIKVKLPERIVYSLVDRRELSPGRVLLYVISLSAMFSFFIPNAITVLTLLPILELLQRAYRNCEFSESSIATMLVLAVIYGANIGGMGSITASPANGILATFLAFNPVAGAANITFASWLVWGIPLVIIFTLIAWLILLVMFRPGRFGKAGIELPFLPEAIEYPHQKLAIWLTAAYFVSSILLSALLMMLPENETEILMITGVLTVVFIGFLFLTPMSPGNAGTLRSPLLRIADCYSNLPLRGFVFVGVAVVLGVVMYFLKVDQYFGELLPHLLPDHLPAIALLLLIALITSFTTEILSNTVVQIAMFLMIVPLSATMDFPVLLALTVTTLSCTSAFMSPIATGVNGLAFGGIPGVSVWRMLVVGLLMNIAGAILLSLWAYFVIGGIYVGN